VTTQDLNQIHPEENVEASQKNLIQMIHHKTIFNLEKVEPVLQCVTKKVTSSPLDKLTNFTTKV
jgi:hypothetical protein